MSPNTLRLAAWTCATVVVWELLAHAWLPPHGPTGVVIPGIVLVFLLLAMRRRPWSV